MTRACSTFLEMRERVDDQQLKGSLACLTRDVTTQVQALHALQPNPSMTTRREASLSRGTDPVRAKERGARCTPLELLVELAGLGRQVDADGEQPGGVVGHRDRAQPGARRVPRNISARITAR
jgi:hypothetical protein